MEAVTAWRLPSRYGFAAVADRATDFEGDARKILADALNEVSSVEPDVIIRSSVVEGHPAEVLVRAARGGGHAGGRQPGTWRIHRGAARLGQPVLRASCPLSCPGHPRDRLGPAMTSTVVNSRTCEIANWARACWPSSGLTWALPGSSRDAARVRAARPPRRPARAAAPARRANAGTPAAPRPHAARQPAPHPAPPPQTQRSPAPPAGKQRRIAPGDAAKPSRTHHLRPAPILAPHLAGPGN